MNRMRDPKNNGFTLIEVMAALLVFSIAIIGLTTAGSQSARAVSVIDDKMVAGVIADNQLILSRQNALKVGIKTGETDAMSRSYTYQVETIETESPGFYRLIVRVKAKDQEQVIVERTAFRTGTRS